MAFKVNIANKGKTAKFEIENEELIGKAIGNKISGKTIDPSLEGYELEITGTSDKAGFPGIPEEAGAGLRKKLLTYGRGLHKRPKGIKKQGDQPKGLRYRKTVRGNEISEDTTQINIKVLKEGNKKFNELVKPKQNPETETTETSAEEKPTEEKAEEKSAEKEEKKQ